MVLFIIFVTIALVIAIWSVWLSVRERDGIYMFLLFVSAFFLLLAGIFIQANFGEQTLTGYIYSAEDDIGDKTVGHIRFSENAGEDSQPSFCVKKEDGEEIKELAGSGKKVRVVIPTGFAIDYTWNCAIPATVEVME